MKLLLDANLSPRTRAYLTEMFHTDGVDGKLGEYSDKSDPMIGNWAEYSDKPATIRSRSGLSRTADENLSCTFSSEE